MKGYTTLIMLVFLPFHFLLGQDSTSCTFDQARADNLLEQSSESNLENAEYLFASYKICLFLYGGEAALEPLKPFSIISSFENGRALARKGNRFVIIDSTYLELNTFKAVYATPPKNGLIKIMNEKGMFGLIDVAGKTILPVGYERIERTADGFVAQRKDTVFFVDRNGKQSRFLAGISSFKTRSPELIEMENSQDQKCLVRSDGEQLLNYGSNPFNVLGSGAGFFVKKEPNYVLYDTRGKEIHVFDWISGNWGETYLPVKMKSENFLLNTSTFQLRSVGAYSPISSVSGYVIVGKNDKYGIIDTAGNIILPVEYDYCGDIVNGCVPVRKDKTDSVYTIRTKSFQPVKYAPSRWIYGNDPLYVAKDKKYGIVNYGQEIIVPFAYDTLIRTKRNNALIQVATGSMDTTKLFFFDDSDLFFVQHQHHFCVYNRKGEQINRFVADEVEQGNGFTVYKDGLKGKLAANGRYFLLDPEYKKILENKYANLFHVEKDGKQGVIYTLNKTIIPVKYDRVQFVLGSYFLVGEKKNVGILDLFGNVVLPVEYDGLEKLDVQDRLLLKLRKNNLYGLYDLETGQYIIPFEYESLTFISLKSPALSVKKNGKRGILNLDGTIRIPLEFDELGFNQHSVCFGKNRKYGLMTESGKILAAPVYDQMTFFTDGLGIVTQNGKKGVINEQGKLIIPVSYYEIGFVGEKRLSFKTEKGWGLMNYSGKVLVQPVYYDSKYFEDGLMCFYSTTERIYVDVNGKIVKREENSGESVEPAEQNPFGR